MATETPLLLTLDLVGVFAFALDGALTSIRAVRLDIVGVITLGMTTALGGGILRDVLIGDVPPATFRDWRFLAVAAAGGLVAFAFAAQLGRVTAAITVLDAVGLSLFAITGATKALASGVGPAQAVILGGVTAVGGGTLRDVLLGQVPTVLRSEVYAIPALAGATVAVAATRVGVYGVPAALAAAAVCFGIRMIGVRYDIDAPRPPGHDAPDAGGTGAAGRQ